MRGSRLVRQAGLALLGVLLGAAPLQAEPGPALRAAAADPAGWYLAAGLGAGAVAADRDLADYRWSTDPAALYALQATAGRGRLAAGARLARWTTTQGTGLADAGPDPQVGLTQFELVGQLRLVQVAGWQLWGSALAGRVRLDYTPDELVIAAGGGAGVTVRYEPITETCLGVGLEVRRDFGRRAAVALVAEQTGFSLATSHRRGAEIVSGRQHFANRSLRLQFAWRWHLG